MSIGGVVGETAVDLMKSENVQNKACEALGLLFPYAGITKKALDMYIAEIENSNMSSEAKLYAVLNAKKEIKRIKNQSKIAQIAYENAKKGTDFSEKAGVADEWFERYMESAAFVSDEQMQMVWGKILANEFEEPGSTPPNITRILIEFTPEYARAFRTICSMKSLLVTIDEDENIKGVRWCETVVFEDNADYMNKQGLSFEILNDLESLGVIKFDAVAGYASVGIKEQKVLVVTKGKVIETSSHQEDRFPIGNVILTAAGKALRRITETVEIDGYEDAVGKYISKRQVSVVEKTQYSVIVKEDKIDLIKYNS